MPNCELCGEPMPEGEEMFKYHGYSGPCPKPSKPALQMEKRPVAFRVKVGAAWMLFANEDEARQMAEVNNVDYQGLYVRDGT